MNPDRLICGLATLFGTMAHSGVFSTARMFEGWLRSRTRIWMSSELATALACETA